MKTVVALIGLFLMGAGFYISGILGALTGVSIALWVGSGIIIAIGKKDVGLGSDTQTRSIQRIGGIVSVIFTLIGAIYGGWRWGWIYGTIGYFLAVGVIWVTGILLSRRKKI